MGAGIRVELSVQATDAGRGSWMDCVVSLVSLSGVCVCVCVCVCVWRGEMPGEVWVADQPSFP